MESSSATLSWRVSHRPHTPSPSSSHLAQSRIPVNTGVRKSVNMGVRKTYLFQFSSLSLTPFSSFPPSLSLPPPPSPQITPPCGTSIAGYEILYSELGAPNTTNHSSFVPQTQPLVSHTNVTFVLNNLRPFSRYEVRVKTVGDNVTMLVSSFTEPINVETLEAGRHHGDVNIRTFHTCEENHLENQPFACN